MSISRQSAFGGDVDARDPCVLHGRTLTSTQEDLEFYINMMLTFWTTAAIVSVGNLTLHITFGCLPKTSAVLVVLTETGSPNRAVENILSRVYICSKLEELSNSMASSLIQRLLRVRAPAILTMYSLGLTTL
jgi:hypothetical protein